MDQPDTEMLLAEQVAYYRAWAPEYDAFAQRDETQLDRPELRRALAAFNPTGDVLELAGGTGNWTVELARYAKQITVVDASEETLSINRDKLAPTDIPVEYVVDDIFEWRPPRRYDAVFFSFWLTHVPPGRFDGFWRLVEHSLEPNGRVFFIDSALPDQAPNADAITVAERRSQVVVVDDLTRGVSSRRLSDGRQYNIVKIYWQPAALQQHLGKLGWSMQVRETAQSRCIYGQGSRTRP